MSHAEIVDVHSHTKMAPPVPRVKTQESGIPIDGGTPEIIRSTNERLAGMMADRRHLVLVPNKQSVAARVAAGDQATVIDTAGREVGNISLPVGRRG